VWSRSPLLRRQRDQARLFDPAASADPEHRAELERGADRPVPIVRYDAKAGERSLDVLRWGLVLFWAKDIKVGFANINAKAEGIEGKPAFREAFQRRRQ
jgi:putative SOS response-associated peptidase YedK